MAMLRLSLIGILHVLVSVPAQGQERQPENCPKISVAGYGGVVILDQVVSFKAVVSDLPREARLIWTLKGGQLESGQGTTEIGVRATRDDFGDNIIATLRVYGLPIGCHDTATESTPVSYTPISEKLLEIRSFNKDDYRNEFDDVKKSLIDNPNSQGFVIVNVREGDTEEQLCSRERLVVESLNLGSVKINRSRITMKRRTDQPTDSIEIWRVPPGAADPFCEACEPSPKVEAKLECPTVSVTGPAGSPNRGEFWLFTSVIKGTIPKGLVYRWSVSKGSIVEGQGKPVVKVASDPEDPTSITVILELIGLPDGCPNTASESLIADYPQAIFIDEFTSPTSKLEKERFKSAVTEQKNNPNNELYIIEYHNDISQFSIRERVRKLTEFLTKEMKLDESYFTIVTEKADKPLTKIYRIPPGAANPEP